MKGQIYFYWVFIFVLLSLPLTAAAQSSSGGSFTLEQTVLAGGGATDSTGGNFKIEGTIGQAGAGTKGVGASSVSYHGFWTPPPFAPTAALVSVSGIISGIQDNGLIRTEVTLSGGANPNPIKVFANKRGYFSFENVEVGQVYIISVQRQGYTFVPETMVLQLFDERSDITFYGIPMP